MYAGGALLLLGLGLDQRSPAIVLFAPAWWLLFHLLVILYEEPVLRSKFGQDYEAYCRRTPRWIPRLMRQSLAGFAGVLIFLTMLLHGSQEIAAFTGGGDAGESSLCFLRKSAPLRVPGNSQQLVDSAE
jgi:hypothetical protein